MEEASTVGTSSEVEGFGRSRKVERCGMSYSRSCEELAGNIKELEKLDGAGRNIVEATSSYS